MTPEREIHARTREELIYLLAEAAEIEHNLMCCYLFAAFGLKSEADGLSKAEAAEIERWKRGILGVAIEEMTHLTLVANLTLAIGGSPHFGRPNFPVASGYHPADIIVQLAALRPRDARPFHLSRAPRGRRSARRRGLHPPEAALCARHGRASG